MNLYLDLRKAGLSSPGVDAESQRRSARSHEESFARVHSGVTGGDASPDKPGVGKQWRGGTAEDKTLDDELEQDRKRDTEIAQERGIVEKPKDDDKDATKKALDVLKSFSTRMETELAAYTPNVREVEYLTEVRGYDFEDVSKGLVRIVGRERTMFNSWLHSRLQASIGRLVR